ncbi:hypothetical protein [Desulfococcus sp.]|uniref:hypothetical protein n=1 Tax=Desulfococcus sp. TaxID=2025834 RepID=UPI0035937B36
MQKQISFGRVVFNAAVRLMSVGFLVLAIGALDTAAAATFKTVNDEVVIDAEQYTRLGGTIGGQWFVNTAKSGFKGTGYIESTKNDPSTLVYKDGIIRAEYDIDFKTAGTYYIHFRTYVIDHTQNGFFATVDGKEVSYGSDPMAYFIWVPNTCCNWSWYTDGGGAEKRGLKVSFNVPTPGVRSFAILRRDKGSHVDQIWLTKNQSVPQNTDEINRPDPSNFIVTGGVAPSPETNCSDGIDNDKDGRIDCADSDCANASNCVAPKTETNCSDGIDNDGDGKVDCADGDCATASNCVVPKTETNCSDGIDNDKDGNTDCTDSDCIGATNCKPPSKETNCSDGIDNDQDGATDCADADCGGLKGPGGGLCEQVEDSCADAYDNDGDGRTDCADADCVSVGACGSTLFSESFTTGAEGFVYKDDTFRGTKNPLYAKGDFVANGGYSGGALRVIVGGVDTVAITNGMSGGWTDTFNLNAGGMVGISLKYRLIANRFDADECGQVLAAIDGKLLQLNGNDYIEQICGRSDSGWKQASFEISLASGSHTLTIGAFNNKKTGALEQAEVFIDDVVITQVDGGGSQPVLGAFGYSDNTFRGTNNALYASGSTEGDALKVMLGGIDEKDITNGMSGGWTSKFTAPVSGSAQINLMYRLITNRYDADECGQALVSVDGKLVGLGGKDYLEQICGIGDSAWQQVTLNINLTAGGHTLTVGGFNNKKTGPNEVTEVLFNGIGITQ